MWLGIVINLLQSKLICFIVEQGSYHETIYNTFPIAITPVSADYHGFFYKNIYRHHAAKQSSPITTHSIRSFVLIGINFPLAHEVSKYFRSFRIFKILLMASRLTRIGNYSLSSFIIYSQSKDTFCLKNICR